MRAKHVKSRIGSRNLFGGLLQGWSGSPEMIKTVECQVTDETDMDQVKAKFAVNPWHLTLG